MANKAQATEVIKLEYRAIGDHFDPHGEDGLAVEEGGAELLMIGYANYESVYSHDRWDGSNVTDRVEMIIPPNLPCSPSRKAMTH